MSLRDRAKQAAAEEARRQARSGPLDVQLDAAGALGQLLECELEPLDFTVSLGGPNYMHLTTEVDGTRLRVGFDIGVTPHTVEFEMLAGHRALKRWVKFETLAELGNLLD